MSAPTDLPPPDYSFASDNTAGLVREAFAALTAANVGAAPPYGEDPWTQRAKRLLGDLFETKCEVFFVFNGTAANALALAALCRSYHHIICHASAHIETDECNAPEFFTGGAKLTLLSTSSGKLSADDVERAIRYRTDVHHAKPGAVSLTQTTDWGQVYMPSELQEIGAIAKRHGLGFHLDGARFANALAALAPQGVRPADLTWRAGVDVLCLGGTKNGLSSTEAVVFFNPEAARDFGYRVKQAGQLAPKQRFASAQWVGVLESAAWLRHAAHANAMAQRLTTALRAARAAPFFHAPANAVFVELPPPAAAALRARGWQFYRFIGEHGHRFMCSWATTPESVDRVAIDITQCLAAGSSQKKAPPKGGA